MRASEVAIATITWARSASEEQLLTRAVGLLAGGESPVAVADRGASATFSEQLRSLPNVEVTVTPAPGLVAQVRASLELASTFDTPFILYTEPDKELFFGQRMAEFIDRAPDHADVGVVLASRSVESFRTFPVMQQYTEQVINSLCGETVGSAGDYSYGPFLLNRALLPPVSSVPDHLGWGWRHFAFVTAHREGFRVLQVTGDYPCPIDQRAEGATDRRHRLRQLSENLLGLIQ